MKLGKTRKPRKNEFLVHFQGWNSSWDRYVLEFWKEFERPTVSREG